MITTFRALATSVCELKILTHYGKVKLESSIWIRVDLTFVNSFVVILDRLDNKKPSVHLQSKIFFSRKYVQEIETLAK